MPCQTPSASTGVFKPNNEYRETEMRLMRVASTMIFIGIAAGVAQAEQEAILLQEGSYEVQVRLELPKVQHWAATKTTRICVPYASDTSDVPLPVLGGNTPFATCPAKNVRRNGAILSFDIVCEGRDGAKARAVYTLMPGKFEGRIAM